MAIDWDATGSMLQGWAGLGQIIVLTFAAYKAADTFKDWRNQRIEERRIDAAAHVVSLAYKIRRAFTAIRTPVTDQREKDDSVVVLLNSGIDLEKMSPEKAAKVVESQVVLDRISTFSDVWDGLAEAAPVATALLGHEIDLQFKRIWKLKSVLEEALQLYPELSNADLRADDTRGVIWQSSLFGHNKRDTFSDEVESAINEIDKLAGPIIRSTQPS